MPAFIFCNRVPVGYHDAEHSGAFLEEALLACRRTIEARKAHIYRRMRGIVAERSLTAMSIGSRSARSPSPS
ncbi:MAG: hypothetical protein GWN84_00225 [Gammaproteobacteria bacterium]|nr:hypothetical protein [Gammaproteobacteria bacterium]NIR81631.1 hypothetical protein [Gammaproteobacteria bacterium]NIR88182.1 hypothetical protein [Gammaproteobacteria bacterium]NIU02743.1 hypothetical protein [Gammaproteobacteria bacterium]NIV73342.1 hypothetical protein [Gammaproteobacteria bacterium]